MSYKSAPLNSRGILPNERQAINPVNITWESAQKEECVIIVRICRKNFTPAFGIWQIANREEYVEAMRDGAAFYRVTKEAAESITDKATEQPSE